MTTVYDEDGKFRSYTDPGTRQIVVRFDTTAEHLDRVAAGVRQWAQRIAEQGGLDVDANGRCHDLSITVEVEGRVTWGTEFDGAANNPDLLDEIVSATQSTGPTGKRRAIIVLPTSYTEHGFVPSLIVEGEPGHSPLLGNGEHAQPWYWGHDFEKAKALADRANADLGLSREDVLEIEVSTHRAQNERSR